MPDAKKQFRKNLKKLIKKRGLTNGTFGALVGMSTERIQRYSDSSKDGRLDLGDADKIASALGTTLGYMTGNVLTDYMLDQTRKMYDENVVSLAEVEGTRKTLALRSEALASNIAYLEEILDKVDALHQKK